MNRRKAITLFFGAALVAGFFFGIVRLFQLRFERGDIYPAYSSLRADPLGTKALHDAMKHVSRLSIGRHLRDLSKIDGPNETTVLWLGESRHSRWGGEVVEFVRNGGRLALAFGPVVSRYDWNTVSPTGGNANSPLGTEEFGRRAEDVLLADFGAGLELGALPVSGRAIGTATAERAVDLALPDRLTWHSAVVFTNLSDTWRVIYQRGTFPVLIEREFGLGSIVASTDSYFVSNEALMNERHSDLLAWLVGENRSVLFNETHLGVASTPGITMLAREYRLHGVFFALLVLAALFIWKSSASFLPRRAEARDETFVAGRDSKEGSVNLLKRHVAANDLLRICFDEWTKSAPGNAAITDRRLDAAIRAFEEHESTLPKKRNATESYRQIALALTRND